MNGVIPHANDGSNLFYELKQFRKQSIKWRNEWSEWIHCNWLIVGYSFRYLSSLTSFNSIYSFNAFILFPFVSGVKRRRRNKLRNKLIATIPSAPLNVANETNEAINLLNEGNCWNVIHLISQFFSPSSFHSRKEWKWLMNDNKINSFGWWKKE